MSREEKNGKKKDEGHPLEVTPDSSEMGHEVAAWLEDLFPRSDDGRVLQHPQKISIQIFFGRNLDEPGEEIDQETFTTNREGKVTEKPPTKEFFVNLANRFLREAQHKCNALASARRRPDPQHFAVQASSTLKTSSDCYKSHWIVLEPARNAVRYRLNGAANGGGHFEEDGEQDPFGGDKILRRLGTIQEDDRWRQDQFAKSIGGMFVMLENVAKRADERADKLQVRVIELLGLVETALSNKQARDLELKKQEFWLKEAHDGVHLVKGLLPPVVNKMVGAEILPTTVSPVTLVFRNFLDSCSDAQIEAAFGKYDKDGAALSPGIFTPRQAFIIEKLAKGEIDAGNVRRLMEGDDRITPEQFAEVQRQRVFSQSQLMPLQNLFMQIMQQQQAAASSAPQNGQQERK